MTMQLHIWSDYACPYCYIGKGHLDQALAEFEHADEVEIVFRAFELDSSAGPEVTTTTQGRIESKYRKSPAAAREMIDRIISMGAATGLDMKYYDVRYTNTFDAHRLTKFAETKGLATPMAMALFKAYFTDLAELAKHEVLADLAVEVGLDRDEVLEMLASDRFAREARNDESQATQMGIQGVPMFAFDETTMLGGAQPKETLLRALRETWAKQQATAAAAEVPMCGIDGCEVPSN